MVLGRYCHVAGPCSDVRAVVAIILSVGGVCRWGRPIGLKLVVTQEGERLGRLAFAMPCIVASGGLLLLALREIPVGTAYAVWTGIDAICSFLVGITSYV